MSEGLQVDPQINGDLQGERLLSGGVRHCFYSYQIKTHFHLLRSLPSPFTISLLLMKSVFSALKQKCVPAQSEPSVRGFYLSRWGVFEGVVSTVCQTNKCTKFRTSLASRQMVIGFKLLLDISLMGECISKAVTSERSRGKIPT